MRFLSDEDRTRLNRLFRRLWANRNGVVGSWRESSYRYHPTFVRRGPILLGGETELGSIWVICPADAKLYPIHGDSRCNMSVFPKFDPETTVIRISESEDGPWWKFIHEEIPLMEQEMDASCDKIRLAAIAEAEQKQAARNEELLKAAHVFESKQPT